MHIKCRYFSRKHLATGGVEPPPQMPLTVNEAMEHWSGAKTFLKLFLL